MFKKIAETNITILLIWKIVRGLRCSQNLQFCCICFAVWWIKNIKIKSDLFFNIRSFCRPPSPQGRLWIPIAYILKHSMNRILLKACWTLRHIYSQPRFLLWGTEFDHFVAKMLRFTKFHHWSPYSFWGIFFLPSVYVEGRKEKYKLKKNPPYWVLIS